MKLNMGTWLSELVFILHSDPILSPNSGDLEFSSTNTNPVWNQKDLHNNFIQFNWWRTADEEQSEVIHGQHMHHSLKIHNDQVHNDPKAGGYQKA